jgi:hypothetical protein
MHVARPIDSVLSILDLSSSILDLSSPGSDVFRASPAPLQQVLAVMGKE